MDAGAGFPFSGFALECHFGAEDVSESADRIAGADESEARSATHALDHFKFFRSTSSNLMLFSIYPRLGFQLPLVPKQPRRILHVVHRRCAVVSESVARHGVADEFLDGRVEGAGDVRGHG